jgi:hypothetical protein
MTIRYLDHSLSGVSGLINVTIKESYSGSVSQAVIECDSTTLELGDSISFQIGFTGDTGNIFTGYVRDIQKDLPDVKTIVLCEDELTKAIDYFMASDDPENPFSRQNITTEDLVEDILNEAGITNFTADLPFTATWGTNGSKVEFNLTTAWLAAKTVADMFAWHIYTDRNGLVHFTEDHPYVEGGDTSSFVWDIPTTENILAIGYSKSAEELRNRVVVYGSGSITATASASSSYLPPGFYKTAVIASQIITNGNQAQQAADLNLARFNRLTESLSMQVEGDWRITPRLFATVTSTYLGVSGDWFIFQAEHQFGKAGYVTNVTLVR